MKHFLTISDYEPDVLQEMLDLSMTLQNEPKPILRDKNILFVFEKPSLRTRVGTEVAINHLGGHVLHVTSDVLLGAGADPVFGYRESMTDTMKNVSQWCNAIFARVYKHQTLQNMAAEADISIVNALCNRHHPMQAMADLYTIQESFGKSKKVSVTFIGDSNNVAFSLIEICLKFGHDVRFAGPEKYFWSDGTLSAFSELSKQYGGSFSSSTDPAEAVKGTDIIYTDTFVSMGEEDLMEEKIQHFHEFQVNEALYSKAKSTTAFMHCLPAHRGMEVTDDIMHHDNSWVYRQAKNRMVVSKGIFARLLT